MTFVEWILVLDLLNSPSIKAHRK